MLVMLTITAIGGFLAYVLIYGAFGAPALGILGAGIAVTISRTAGAVLVLYLLTRGTGVLKLDLSRLLIIDFTEIKRILRIGFPAGIEQAQMRVAMTLYAVTVASMGTVAYAAHTIAMRIEGIAFMPGWGFGVAATTLVGQGLGAKRPDLSQRCAYLAQRYAVLFMVGLGVPMLIFSEQFMALFINDEEVIRLGSMYLRLWFLAMPMMATSNALAGGLRGAGDTRWVLLIITACIWLIRVPLGYTLGIIAKLGVWTVWAAAVLDVNTRGVFI